MHHVLAQQHVSDRLHIVSPTFVDAVAFVCVSDLLAEETEPFEVLPDAQLGPALWAAVRVLCADEEAFSSWSSLSDAVCIQREDAGQPSANGASANGGHTTLQAAASEHQADAAQHILPNNADIEAEDLGELEPMAASAAAAALGINACRCLQAAMQHRLGQYLRSGVEEDEVELAALDDSSQMESIAAHRAALLLAIGEKRLLLDALAASEPLSMASVPPQKQKPAVAQKRQKTRPSSNAKRRKC